MFAHKLADAVEQCFTMDRSHVLGSLDELRHAHKLALAANIMGSGMLPLWHSV